MPHAPARSLLAAGLLALSTQALAQTYIMVSPLRSAKVAPKTPEPPPEQPISLSLATASLPTAVLQQHYQQDLKGLVSVSGDAAYTPAAVGWSLAGGTLPAGLALTSGGVIEGTPTAVNQAGASFQVQASYKGKSGQQTYTLAVLGAISQFAGYRAWSDGTLAASCKEYLSGKAGFAYAGATGDGVYRIQVPGFAPFDVVCDQTTDGGGWTVLQRRWNGSVDFYRGWAEYAAGFGTTTEYWLGNDRLAAMTATGSHSLRIDMARTNGQTAYALYSGFKINPASDKYRLKVSWAGGTAGNSLGGHSGLVFSTYDADHDTWPSNCAVSFKGAWWYASCHGSNLNGAYLNGPHTSYADSIIWATLAGAYESLTRSEMKLRQD